MSTEPKKQETPKAQASSGNGHQDTVFPQFPNIDPMAYWTQSQQSFQKIVGDAYSRAQSFAEQYAALEAQMIARAQGAVSNWAQLAQEAIAYGAQLSAEARKLSVETMRKMGFSA